MAGKQLAWSDYHLTTTKRQIKREKIFSGREVLVP